MKKHLGKALVGLAAAAASVGLLGLPASAATGDVVDGDLVLIASDQSTLQTLDFGDTGNDCQSVPNTLNMTGSTTAGSFTATLVSDTKVNIGGVNFRATLNSSLGGTYTSGTLSGTGSATATLQRTTGANCDVNTTAGTCTITVTGITVNGTHTVTAPPTIQSGATAIVSGDNGDAGDFGFEVSVTDTGAACGSITALDDGAVQLINIELVAD